MGFQDLEGWQGWLWVGVTVGAVAFPDPSGSVQHLGAAGVDVQPRGPVTAGWVLEQGWVLELEQTWEQLDWGAQSPHHTTEFGAKQMLSAASEKVFPRISLIQGTSSRSFRVLKHKPITPQRPPGPSGDECARGPFFCSRTPWHPHVAQGDRDEPASPQAPLSPPVLPPRAFLVPHGSVSLRHVPPRLADSDFSTACWK